MSDWISQILLHRKTAKSNVILVETEDPKRLWEYKEWAVKKGIRRGNKSVGMVLYYDLQGRELEILKNVEGEPIEAESLYDLDRYLKTKPVHLILAWVEEVETAKEIMPTLFYWSQHDRLYVPESEVREYVKLPSTVVVFTHSLDFFPENVRRFMAEVRVYSSTPEERQRIISSIIRAFKIAEDIPREIIEASSGLNLHEVETATLESLTLYKRLIKQPYTKIKIDILARYGLRYIEPKRGFESVGGYKILKDWFRNKVIKVLSNPEIAYKYGVKPPRGIILYGYPGCGKTWFAKALAKELGYPFIQLNASDFLRGIVGETESRTRKIIELLESMAPAIVFIDEIDQLFLARNQVMSTDSGVTRRLQNMLLEWLGDEDRKTFLIGATNFIEQMDFAALRVGRIDKIVLVLPPDYEARKEIFKIHMEMIGKPRVPVEVDYDLIAEKTYMWTGSELQQLAVEAKNYAMEEEMPKITTDAVLEVMKYLRKNIDKRKEEVRRMIDIAKRLENIDLRFLEEALKIYREEEKKFENVRLDSVW